MKALCVIPARGGSKRIPLKNIKKFLGKPLIYYTIKSAKENLKFLTKLLYLQIQEKSKKFP